MAAQVRPTQSAGLEEYADQMDGLGRELEAKSGVWGSSELQDKVIECLRESSRCVALAVWVSGRHAEGRPCTTDSGSFDFFGAASWRLPGDLGSLPGAGHRLGDRVAVAILRGVGLASQVRALTAGRHCRTGSSHVGLPLGLCMQ